MTHRRPGRPRKDPFERPPPRTSDLQREQRATAISGTAPRLAELDRLIHACWLAGSIEQYAALEKERDAIEQENGRLANNPVASTELGRHYLAGRLDLTQYQAGEAFEAMADFYYGPLPGRPNPRTRSALAAFVAETAPALSNIADDDFATQRRRKWKAMRECYAHMWDWRTLEGVVRFDERMGLDTSRIGGELREPIAILRHDLDEVAKILKIERPSAR